MGQRLEGCGQSRGAGLDQSQSHTRATAWVSEAAPGLSNGVFLIHTTSEVPPSEPDPTKRWKPCQLFKAWKSPSAKSPASGILGARGAECRTQSCQESLWPTATCQKWVSFLCGFPLTAPGFDNQEGWVEWVSAGFLSGTSTWCSALLRNSSVTQRRWWLSLNLPVTHGERDRLDTLRDLMPLWDSPSCLVGGKPNISSSLLRGGRLFGSLLVCLLAWAASFLVAVKRRSQKKRAWVKFGVKDYNTSFYFPKPFRVRSGLNHASGCCGFSMTIMKAVGSFANWKFIWTIAT